MKSNERLLWIVVVVVLVVLNTMPRGPRWGVVVDVRTSQLQNNVCVAGNLESACYDVSDRIYRGCYVGDWWEDGHCEPWHDTGDPPPWPKDGVRPVAGS